MNDINYFYSQLLNDSLFVSTLKKRYPEGMINFIFGESKICIYVFNYHDYEAGEINILYDVICSIKRKGSDYYLSFMNNDNIVSQEIICNPKEYEKTLRK